MKETNEKIKNLQEYLRENATTEFILFLILKEFKELRAFAKYCNVSEKMILLYIEQYYIPRNYPKFLRKKEGGYPAFKFEVDRMIRSFAKKIVEKAIEKNITPEEMADIVLEFIA